MSSTCTSRPMLRNCIIFQNGILWVQYSWVWIENNLVTLTNLAYQCPPCRIRHLPLITHPTTTNQQHLSLFIHTHVRIYINAFTHSTLSPFFSSKVSQHHSFLCCSPPVWCFVSSYVPKHTWSYTHLFGYLFFFMYWYDDDMNLFKDGEDESVVTGRGSRHQGAEIRAWID